MDTKYYEQQIWDSYDTQITQNNFILSTIFTKDKYGISPTRIKFSIINYKNRMFESVTCSHKDIFLYLAKFKPINEFINSKGDSVFQNSDNIKHIIINAKRNLRSSFLNRQEYNGICHRFTIFENDANYSNNASVYMGHFEYLSLIKILVDYRDSYLSLSNTSQNIIYLESMTDKIDILNDKLSNIRASIGVVTSDQSKIKSEDYLSKKKLEDFPLNDTNCSICGDPQYISPSGIVCKNGHGGAEPEDTNDDSVDAYTTIEDAEEALTQIEKSVAETLQSDLDNFITNNADKMDIGLDPNDKFINEIIATAPTAEIAKIKSDIFTGEFLEGSLKVFENYINNISSNKLPFHSFTNILAKKLNQTRETLLPDCSDKQYWQIVYLTSRYAKGILNKHLNKQVNLPASISPIRYKNAKSTKLNRHIMHDLLLYFVYYTHISKQLQERDQNTTSNKSIICFVLKSVLSPYVFSFFKDIPSKEVLISEILGRYKKYKKLNVFFDVEQEIEARYGNDITISNNSIRDTLTTLYSAVINNPTEFWIENFFGARRLDNTILFSYEEFSKYEFDEEQINVILAMETAFSHNGIVNFDSLPPSIDKKLIPQLPEMILSKFGLESRHHNTKNLIRFIKEDMCESPYLENALKAAEEINESYHDLKNKSFEFANFSENVLKAFCVWDVKIDKNLTLNYKYMKDKIDQSSVDKVTALSLLSSIDEKVETSFSLSLDLSS